MYNLVILIFNMYIVKSILKFDIDINIYLNGVDRFETDLF